MNRSFFLVSSLLCLANIASGKQAPVKSFQLETELARYNTVFTTPSQDETGSIPLGNGNVGANLWVEENGDLFFYVNRNDSLAETISLCKLGRVRIALTPNPFRKGLPYHQELKLIDGRCDIDAGEKGKAVHLSVFVDSGSQEIRVAGSCQVPTRVKVSLYDWRADRRDFHNRIGNAVYPMRDAPADVDNYISADHWDESEPDAIVAYHRNEYSVVSTHVNWQDMGAYASEVAKVDPITKNTFGTRISIHCSEAVQRESNHEIRTKKPVENFDVIASTYARQTPDTQTWLAELRMTSNRFIPVQDALARTSEFWHEFWNRSWMFVSGDSKPKPDASPEESTPSVLTRAYVLNKFQMSCQMRSKLPANFQGGMFRVDPKLAFYALDYRDEPSTPDDQFYGNSYWWQNTRFLYTPLLAQGSHQEYRSFLTFMNRLAPVMEARAKKYYGAQGIYFEECFSPFGLPVMGDFGWGAKEYSEPYARWTWQHCLEASVMMLDDFTYTEDKSFLQEVAIPYCNRSLLFFETRFKKDAAGKIRIFPTHGLETYWDDVVNDTPTVAGLHYVLKRLLLLPHSVTTAEQRSNWKRLQGMIPPIAKRMVKGQAIPDNAESYHADQRANYEAPDLYTVFPFRVYGLEIKNTDIREALGAYKIMPNIEHVCWNQFGIFSARLGQTEGAKEDVVVRSQARMVRMDKDSIRPPFRFPGYMGSPHDATPDYDGPCNMMTTLQEMILQPGENGEILLFPAWPKDWDIHFKLNAPRNTTLEGSVVSGQLVNLEVTPANRIKDIRLSAGWKLPSKN